MSEPLDDARELALPVEYWTVDLSTGDSIRVLAHAYSVEGGYYHFSLLFRGAPNVDVTSLKIPASLVLGTRD